MIKYINIKSDYGVETVDEFDYNTKADRQYFRKMLNEYNISDLSNYYYPSQRCTNDWRKKWKIKLLNRN